jgi:hypothetical protein
MEEPDLQPTKPARSNPFKDVDPIIFLQILVSVALIAGVYFAGQYWRQYQVEKAELLATELRLAEEEKLALQAQNNLRDAQLSALQAELQELKNKPPEIQVERVSVPAVDTTVSLVKEWNPRVAKIECTWAFPNGVPYARGSGSATLVFHDGVIKAITSKHVLLYQNQYGPDNCKLTVSTGATYTVLNNQEDNYFVGTEEDWGFIRLQPDSTLNTIVSKSLSICRDVDIGDRVLGLGYPSIGSDVGLTVTEGIVSGFDGNYFITSAKIDKGNSGGAAILAKNSCYLGIPTASVVGSIESLGRVLKASFVID